MVSLAKGSYLHVLEGNHGNDNEGLLDSPSPAPTNNSSPFLAYFHILLKKIDILWLLGGLSPPHVWWLYLNYLYVCVSQWLFKNLYHYLSHHPVSSSLLASITPHPVPLLPLHSTCALLSPLGLPFSPPCKGPSLYSPGFCAYSQVIESDPNQS